MTHQLNAAITALLLIGCASDEEREHASLMDEVEQRVRLPDGSQPLNEYARYYAIDGQGRVVAIYTTFVEPDLPAGQRRWVGDQSKLPGISDGGCGVVNVLFNPATRKVEEAFCNGVA